MAKSAAAAKQAIASPIENKEIIMKHLLSLMVPLLLIGCTTMPTGPRVMALPGSGKTFDQFRADDFECQQWALSRVGVPSQAANESALKSAAVGTVVGALAGAAISGGHQGAAAGAGTGLIVGSMAGASAADASSYGAQRMVDQAYVQCMYAKGQRVPVSGRLISMPVPTAVNSPPPPPPPGTPPPPPPGVTK